MARPKGVGGKTPERIVSLLREEVDKTSQAATARATGLTLAGVQNYLQGAVEPTTATLEKLANYFEVDAGYLTGSGLYCDSEMSLEEAREFKKSIDVRTADGRSNLFRAVSRVIVGKKDEGSADYNALRANDFEHWTDSLRGLLRRVLPQFDEKEVVLVGNQMVEMINDEVKTVVERKTAQGKTRISNLYEKLRVDTQEVLGKLKESGYEAKPARPRKPRKGE